MGLAKNELKLYMSSNPGSDGGTIDLNREISNNLLNNLFDDVPHASAITGLTTYRKVFIKNTNTQYTWFNVKFWIYKQVTGNGQISIGIGTDSDTDGSAISYSVVLTENTALALGDIIPDGVKSIWIKRVIQANANAIQSDNYQLAFTGNIAN